MTRSVVRTGDLPQILTGRHMFEGHFFGLNHLTVILGDTLPGQGAPLHRHDYEELIIVHSGRGTYTVGDETAEGGPGDLIVIPSGVPHRFRNDGPDTLSHTAVHATGTFHMDVLGA